MPVLRTAMAFSRISSVAIMARYGILVSMWKASAGGRRRRTEISRSIPSLRFVGAENASSTTLDEGAQSMNILVTGACGRIGSHVVRQLLARGIDVVGVDSVVHAGHLGELSGRLPLRTVDVQDLAGLLHAVTA